MSSMQIYCSKTGINQISSNFQNKLVPQNPCQLAYNMKLEWTPETITPPNYLLITPDILFFQFK